MKSFEDFRNSILGKIYRKKYYDNEVYLVVDVCGRRDNPDIKSRINVANVIYLKISIPSERITTSFYSDNECLMISNNEVEFNRSGVLSALKDSYHIDPNCTLDDIVNYYKTVNANIKDLLRGVGAEL